MDDDAFDTDPPNRSNLLDDDKSSNISMNSNSVVSVINNFITHEQGVDENNSVQYISNSVTGESIITEALARAALVSSTPIIRERMSSVTSQLIQNNTVECDVRAVPPISSINLVESDKQADSSCAK